MLEEQDEEEYLSAKRRLRKELITRINNHFKPDGKEKYAGKERPSLGFHLISFLDYFDENNLNAIEINVEKLASRADDDLYIYLPEQEALGNVIGVEVPQEEDMDSLFNPISGVGTWSASSRLE